MKLNNEYEIKDNALPTEEAEKMIKSLINMPIYQSLKSHCERKSKKLTIIFEKDQTILKCN